MNWDSAEIQFFVQAALDEDIGAGDLTARAIVPPDVRARAKILARRALVVAGVPLAERVFRALDPAARLEAHIAEGGEAAANSVLAHVECRARALLTGERSALNLLTHLSGVATITRQFVRAVAGTNTKIRDTRKTLPLLRRLEKYAVRMGGGENHRMGLYDAILIKENHIAAAGGVTEAFRRARAFLPCPSGQRETTAYESFAPPAPGWDEPVPIQIEVRNEAELREALEAGADSLLLDNTTPAEAARLVAFARNARPGCVLELSGGVTLENVRAYAAAGADYISVGALTHSAPAADLSLLVELPSRL